MFMQLPVSTLADAKLVLDRERMELHPARPEDRPFYVERGTETLDSMMAEAASAAVGDRPFRWFFTGHTGAGKSTELNRVINDQRLLGQYLPAIFSVREKLDINNLDFTDLLLGIAQCVVSMAEDHQVKVPAELTQRIEKWGQEVEIETETGGEGSGKTGFEWNFLLMKATAEIQAGGSLKKVIREKMRDRLTDFIKLIDDLAQEMEKSKQRRPLVVLDGLDHVDFRPIQDIFTNHWASISKPRVSLLIVVPLPLLNEPKFMAYVQDNYSLLSNVKVFTKAGSDDLDSTGFKFFKEVISRLASLDLFTDKALREIFRLSGGMLRDMIGLAGDAAKYADAEDPQGKVKPAHVTRVLNDRKAYFRRLLSAKDFEVLRRVRENPYPLGFDGIGPLLHLKAIIFYPNGEGWYGLHPAVQSILDAAPASASPDHSRAR